MFEQFLFLLFYYQSTVPPEGTAQLPASSPSAIYGTNALLPITRGASQEVGEKKLLIPHQNPGLIAPIMNANAVFAQDMGSRAILYQKNIHARLKMASISKLITAMVILDRHSLDEVVTVSPQATKVEGSKVWLKAHEKLTVRDLLSGLLIPSGNDAAVALAIHDSGSVGDFVEKMNQKARDLGLKNSHFTNPTGLDDYENYTTAFDISIFAKAALEYEAIRETVKKPKLTIISLSGIKHELESTNKMFGNPRFNVQGLKTGSTVGAGEAFVGLTEDHNGVLILTVILGSTDRFAETEFLLDWIWRAFTWEER